MEEPGHKLKKARESLDLRYRDVESASQKLASRHRNSEYYVALSRLADIENRGTVPSIFRLYSLCVIYRLEFAEVLSWYGVRLHDLPADAAQVEVGKTHLLDIKAVETSVPVPVAANPQIDARETSFVMRHIREWGRLPVQMVSALDYRHHRYGFVGSDDWSMYPVLPPGSLVQIDANKRKVVAHGWTHESERPIYLVEHRQGHACGWCSIEEPHLVMQFHPLSNVPPKRFRMPEEAEILGQVVGVAMRLDLGKRRRTRS